MNFTMDQDLSLKQGEKITMNIKGISGGSANSGTNLLGSGQSKGGGLKKL